MRSSPPRDPESLFARIQREAIEAFIAVNPPRRRSQQPAKPDVDGIVSTDNPGAT